MKFHRQNTGMAGLMVMVATTSNASALRAQTLPEPVTATEVTLPEPTPPVGGTTLNVTAAAGTVTNLTVPVGVTSISITIPTATERPMGSSESEVPPVVTSIAIAIPPAAEPTPAAPPISTESTRGGALASLGIVAGVVLAAQLATDVSVDPTPTAMPFIGALPFVWGTRGGESRTYCANVLWLDSASPQVAADALATARTKADLGREEVTPAEVFRATGWRLGEPANCSPLQNFGFYVGLPVPYAGDVHFTEGRAAREIRSLFSAGLLFAMPPYLTVVVGYGMISFDEYPDTNPGMAYTGAFTFGIGTSLDLLDFLLSR